MIEIKYITFMLVETIIAIVALVTLFLIYRRFNMELKNSIIDENRLLVSKNNDDFVSKRSKRAIITVLLYLIFSITVLIFNVI